MSALWTSDELVNATGGTASSDFSITGVAFDSREVGPGDLFIAMQGETADGHDFVDGAYASGAAGAIVSVPVAGPHILVADTAQALDALGRASRARTEAKIIGVTGSVGKTGTKEALFSALNRTSLGHAHRSVKSYNNHVGVPLSLSRMPAGCAFGVFEMGMNHAGELAALTQLVRPHAAIITAIAPAHIGNFADEAGIADAKAEIFEGLEPGGTAIIPFDSPHFSRLQAKAQQHAAHIVSFGFGDGADVRAIDVVAASGGGSLVTVNMPGKRLCFTIAAEGRHWVSNTLAIMAAVDAVGGDLAQAGLALAEMDGLDGRGKRHRISLKSGGEFLLIDESYNANPVSMRATLQNLGETPVKGRRLAVLGAMGEMGDMARHYHEALADDVVAAKLDALVLVGDDMEHLARKLANTLEAPREIYQCALAEKALDRVVQMMGEGDVLLVKGSNFLGLARLVKALVSGGY